MSLIPEILTFTFAISCVTTSNLLWFMGLTFQACNIVLIALDFTFITRHIHNWASFPRCHSCFILSGDVSNCPLLFSSSILDIFHCHSLLEVMKALQLGKKKQNKTTTCAATEEKIPIDQFNNWCLYPAVCLNQWT